MGAGLYRRIGFQDLGSTLVDLKSPSGASVRGPSAPALRWKEASRLFRDRQTLSARRAAGTAVAGASPLPKRDATPGEGAGARLQRRTASYFGEERHGFLARALRLAAVCARHLHRRRPVRQRRSDCTEDRVAGVASRPIGPVLRRYLD
jgi:hypothetical protein